MILERRMHGTSGGALAIAVVLLLSGGGLQSAARMPPVEGAPIRTLTLWPAELNATLRWTPPTAGEHLDPTADEDAKWEWTSTGGGVLGSSFLPDAVIIPGAGVHLPVGDAMTSFQLTYVPGSAPPSTTFDRVYGSAVGVPHHLHATGLHVHLEVKLSSSPGPSAWEAITRHLVTEALGPFRFSSSLSSELARGGFLASAVCPTSVLGTAQPPPRCLAASWPATDVATKDDLVEMLVHQHFPAITRGSEGPQLRALIATARRVGDDLVVDHELLWWSPAPTTQREPTLRGRLAERTLVVSSIDETSGTATVTMHQATVESTTVTVDLPPIDRLAAAAVKVHVIGEGFHQRVQIEIRPTPGRWPLTCLSEEITLLASIPLSSTVYADLDELRRMERFGSLRLVSEVKHIEIERPSSVSGQHSIALEFPRCSSSDDSSLLVEFPIHLRYQSPSETDYFASATLVAPELWVACGKSHRDQVVQPQNLKATGLPATFTKWLHDSPSHWRRVAPSEPVTIAPVAVPVGFRPHGPLVSTLTLSVTALGALVLIYVAISSKSPRPHSNISTAPWRPKRA